MSFRFRSAAELVAAYLSGRETPSQVAERAIGAALALDQRTPPMRAFVELYAEEARQEAAQATERWRAGTPRGPLDGIPIAVKDEYDLAGHGTRCGTSFLGGEPATVDALAVARMRAAGAVILGKTNMYELGVQPSGNNPHHGTARNPYDPARDTGGSSSGSAGAVAAGVVPIALGNDGGGSIRIPASLCGVAGLKPTYGRVPTQGVPVLCWSLEHSGPIGGSVEDLRTALEVITDEPIALPALGERSLRIGVCESWWRPADHQVARICDAAVRALEAAGARLIPVALPHIEHALAVGAAIFSAEGASALERHLDEGAPMSAPVRVVFELARGLSAPALIKAQRVRTLIARDFASALEQVDVLVSPTTAWTAPRYREDALAGGEIDEARVNAMVWFTMPLNLTGHPAASVPCGYDGDGLPVGLQVIAAPGQDALALAVAAAVEASCEQRRPQVWSDLLQGMSDIR